MTSAEQKQKQHTLKIHHIIILLALVAACIVYFVGMFNDLELFVIVRRTVVTFALVYLTGVSIGLYFYFASLKTKAMDHSV